MKNLILLTVLLLTSCGGDGGQNQNTIPTEEVQISRNITQTTKEGIHVFSIAGVSNETLDSIDKGFDSVIQDAKLSGYGDTGKSYYPSFYEVFIPTELCVPSPEQHVPSFKLRADNYDGTQYDQYNPKGYLVKDGIGVIWASEQVVNNNGMIICTSGAENNFRYGAEHIIIKEKDPTYYEQTKTHTLKGHPLLPKK
jgi:hypothetical protein